MIGDKFISNKNGKYLIHKTIDGEEYFFGEYSNLDDAIKEHDLLEFLGWPTYVALSSNDNKTSQKTLDDKKTKNAIHKSIPTRIDEPHSTVSFKIGSAYKHGFLVLTRSETEDIIPKLPYEKECDVIFDGIKAKIKLNVLLRLSLTKGNEELRNHLKELSDFNPNMRANIDILLNKEDENPITVDNSELIEQLNESEKKIDELNELIKDYEEILSEKELLIHKLKKEIKN
ncbi:hypothetical protein [Methanobrevibacter millerae]|uniref:Uncharacterized protein n=1 Tax=Methanobrevibacter millerae TaxID=230361 RepID=A0A1G5X4K3_9EURY|nr:hypothetical protein [Methanobrevibacter millerae]SDA65160.1 hypothetical protein SAMN02910315_01947 [Methanobrevibacter millerae]